MAKIVCSDQTTALGTVCSGSTLFDSILDSSVMLGNYLQQTSFFRCIFSCLFNGKFSLLLKHMCTQYSHITVLPSDNFPAKFCYSK